MNSACGVRELDNVLGVGLEPLAGNGPGLRTIRYRCPIDRPTRPRGIPDNLSKLGVQLAPRGLGHSLSRTPVRSSNW